MKTIATIGALAAIAGIAAPAAAQTYQQGYGHQGYGHQGGIPSLIAQLLGNRYHPNDRAAITQCASAASAQATSRYRPVARAYGQPYAGATMARVTEISHVQRLRRGLRVTGVLDSGMGMQGRQHGNMEPKVGPPGYEPPGASQQSYGQPSYGQQVAGQQAYGPQGDLTFRCNVDYSGRVTDVRIGRNRAITRR
jgi:hypothetical protein